ASGRHCSDLCARERSYTAERIDTVCLLECFNRGGSKCAKITGRRSIYISLRHQKLLQCANIAAGCADIKRARKCERRTNVSRCRNSLRSSLCCCSRSNGRSVCRKCVKYRARLRPYPTKCFDVVRSLELLQCFKGERAKVTAVI